MPEILNGGRRVCPRTAPPGGGEEISLGRYLRGRKFYTERIYYDTGPTVLSVLTVYRAMMACIPLRIGVLLLACISATQAYYTPVSANMRSFSSAIKNGLIAPKEEKVLYEHNTGQPGVITEQWFTGKGYQ